MTILQSQQYLEHHFLNLFQRKDLVGKENLLDVFFLVLQDQVQGDALFLLDDDFFGLDYVWVFEVA